MFTKEELKNKMKNLFDDSIKSLNQIKETVSKPENIMIIAGLGVTTFCVYMIYKSKEKGFPRFFEPTLYLNIELPENPIGEVPEFYYWWSEPNNCYLQLPVDWDHEKNTSESLKKFCEENNMKFQ